MEPAGNGFLKPATSIDAVRGLIDRSRTIVALTGAGISTDSGIPDFRGPNGVWTRNPGAERLADIHHYTADPEVRRQSWQQRLNHPAWTAEPNAAHLALAHLEAQGRLHRVITQNVDGLHLRAGHDPARVIEVHGTIRDVVCLDCDDRAPMQRALDRVRAGEDDPSCRDCGGILKSATVSFGQSLDRHDLANAEQAAIDADLFLAVGTTLMVHPVAALAWTAKAHGARVVVINGEPTAFDHEADFVLRGPIGEILPAIVAPQGAVERE